MKKIFLLLALFFGGAALADGLTNKSLRVGNTAHPNPFAICVAQQAVTQLVAKTNFYLRLLHSSPDLNSRPAMHATLVFLAQNIDAPKKNIFQIVLTSLDVASGWQQIQQTDGEIAPYSALVSNKAVVIKSDGSIVGDIDLAACAQF
jgi:hypothetical protein